MTKIIKENKLITALTTLWLLFGVRVLYVSTQKTVVRGYIDSDYNVQSYSATPSIMDGFPGFLLLFVLPVALIWGWKWYQRSKRVDK